MTQSQSNLNRSQGLSQPSLRSALARLRGWALAGGLIAAAGLSAGGCATTASAGYYSDPELVYVSPGVQVIADWNEPIFFADGFYWRNVGGVWYRSSYYSGGWVYARPPGVILSIHSPHVYRHYRPHGWAPRPRGGAAPIVRGAPPPQRGSFGPGVRAAPPMAGPGRAPSRPGFGPHVAPAPGPGPRAAPPSRARSPFMGHGHSH